MRLVHGFPEGVYVGQTTLQHKQVLPSEQPDLAGFNLALHVDDQLARVQQHRIALLNDLGTRYGVQKLTWLNQTHSTLCHNVQDTISFEALVGDGLITQQPNNALMIMTADCLPVVLVDRTGQEIANLHAGWRGLANGIIENTLESMQNGATWAWLGAAISQPCFEVGLEVKEIFCTKYPDLARAFEESSQEDKFYANLYAIAYYILDRNGVRWILGGDQCTYRQTADYYSYRRNAHTGRMATFVFRQG